MLDWTSVREPSAQYCWTVGCWALFCSRLEPTLFADVRSYWQIEVISDCSDWLWSPLGAPSVDGEAVSEVQDHALWAGGLYSDCRTVIDVDGQDMKPSLLRDEGESNPWKDPSLYLESHIQCHFANLFP